MSEALANMAKRVPNTDVVIEVRDSRLPFASDEAGLDKLTARLSSGFVPFLRWALAVGLLTFLC
jgi:hypothetical protein